MAKVGPDESASAHSSFRLSGLTGKDGKAIFQNGISIFYCYRMLPNIACKMIWIRVIY